MNHIDMSVIVDVKKQSSFTQDLSKVFISKVKNRLDEYDWDTSPEGYIVDCIKIAYWQQSLKLKLGTYKKQKEMCGENCLCCLNTIQTGEYKRTLPCKHVFHKKCIDKWLFKYNNYTCPQCRCELLNVHGIDRSRVG